MFVRHRSFGQSNSRQVTYSPDVPGPLGNVIQTVQKPARDAQILDLADIVSIGLLQERPERGLHHRDIMQFQGRRIRRNTSLQTGSDTPCSTCRNSERPVYHPSVSLTISMPRVWRMQSSPGLNLESWSRCSSYFHGFGSMLVGICAASSKIIGCEHFSGVGMITAWASS